MCRDANLGPQVKCHRLGEGWGRQSGDVPFHAAASFPVSRLCFAGLTPETASAAPLHQPQPACKTCYKLIFVFQAHVFVFLLFVVIEK